MAETCVEVRRHHCHTSARRRPGALPFRRFRHFKASRAQCVTHSLATPVSCAAASLPSSHLPAAAAHRAEDGCTPQKCAANMLTHELHNVHRRFASRLGNICKARQISFGGAVFNEKTLRFAAFCRSPAAYSAHSAYFHRYWIAESVRPRCILHVTFPHDFAPRYCLRAARDISFASRASR